ncbi:MAG: hypothetical protein OXF24_09595 [Hyphomicrobiales bacterium]|nr:hypothetical protein [Hyphomicrobiales bacterium]
MMEVQRHGFTFEEWVSDVFFDGYNGKYMQKWDIPAEHNQSTLLPPELRSLPVSVKLIKYGSSIALGDVLRQRTIDTDFLIIVGFWRQTSPTEKNIVEIAAMKFLRGDWQALWSDLTLEGLQEIDRHIKNPNLHYSQARADAKQWKLRPEMKRCRLIINPKIDSKTQRRVQCSLPFRLFWELAGRKPEPSSQPALFGQAFPNPILSPSRTFN